MTLSADLIVIEGAGKLRCLYSLVDCMGLKATCLATLGHMMQSPAHLRPLAIERTAAGEYLETDRVPCRPDALERLSDAIRRLTGRLLIATDDDAEGHAIAADVAQLCRRLRPELVPLRLILRELSEPAFRAALEGARPLSPDAAAPAIARRIADRVIASAFSRPGDGLIVGRVVAGVAALADAGAFPSHRLTLQMPAVDGGSAFTATTAVIGGADVVDSLKTAAASASGLETLGTAYLAPLSLPPVLSDFLLAMGEGSRMSVTDAAGLLQGLYESGAINYPRTAGRHYSPTSLAAIGRYALSRGVRPNVAVASSATGSAHEALRIVNDKVLATVDPSLPLNLQRSSRDVALAWITRRMVESVTSVQRELGDASRLPAGLRELTWTRERGARPSWSSRPSPSVRVLTQQQSLLQGLLDAEIGRPSTYVGHVVRGIERGIVTQTNALGEPGRCVLDAIPKALRDPGAARRMEQVCEASRFDGIGAAVDAALKIAIGNDGTGVGSILEGRDHEEPLRFAM